VTKRIGLVLSVIVIVLLCVFLFGLFEYYEEDVDTGWSTKAKQNDYLALEQLSKQRELSVFSSDDFQEIGDLSDYDVFYISNSSLIISDQRLNTILEWVDQGGHLIISALTDSEEKNDRLLTHFEFTISAFNYSYFFDGDDEEADEDIKSISDDLREYNESIRQQSATDAIKEEKSLTKEEIAKAQILTRESIYDDDDLTQLSFTEIEGELLSLFDTSITIDHPAFYDQDWHSDDYDVDYWQSSEYGVHFAQASYGNGLVSVISGNDIWKNEYIDLFDNAYLWLILSGGYKTAILFGSNMPSLFSIMARYLPETIYSSIALLILWLWSSMKRFGPTRDIDIQSRRSYSEHISASAGFFWRKHWYDKLLKPLRSQIMLLAEARITGFTQADNEERYLLLSKQCGLSTSQVYQAFVSEARINQDLFTHTVQDLQRIRESL
jgi:hypothetical protein